MPCTPQIDTPTGKVRFHCTISTPTIPDAKSIDEKLPTIVFLHSAYIAQEIFQLQFQDARVRRFNCVAVDLRGHGLTEGVKIPKGYDGDAAAEEMHKLMGVLKIRQYHIVAQSLGTIIALPLAMKFQNAVQSLFLISPLGLDEPPDIAEGREQIAEYWKQGFDGPSQDTSLLQDAVWGAMQLGFSNNMDSLAHALVARTYPLSLTLWGPDNFDDYERITVDFSNRRKGYSPSELVHIKCPVKLIHGANDLVLALETTETFLRRLRAAGVTASLEVIPGAPHWACETSGDAINPLIHDFVLKACRAPVPDGPQTVISPWTADLCKLGWDKGADDSD